MKWWLVLVIAFGSVACQVRMIPVPTPVIEEAVEEPYVEPTATPDCQPSPEVMLEVQKIDARSVRLHASGLQPGEVPRIIYGASAQGEGLYADEGEFRVGADDQGDFTHTLSGLELGRTALDGPYTATWDIRFIHSRGVACATITLP